MNQQLRFEFGLVFSTFILAVLMTLLPFSAVVSSIMPQWVLLYVLYWVLVRPEKYGVVFAFFIGLLLDAITGATLGLHAFMFVFLSYCALKFRMPLRLLPMWQQILGVAIFVFINLLIEHLIISWLGAILPPASIWVSIISSALIWPVLVFVIGSCQRRRAW